YRDHHKSAQYPQRLGGSDRDDEKQRCGWDRGAVHGSPRLPDSEFRQKRRWFGEKGGLICFRERSQPRQDGSAGGPASRSVGKEPPENRASDLSRELRGLSRCRSRELDEARAEFLSSVPARQNAAEQRQAGASPDRRKNTGGRQAHAGFRKKINLGGYRRRP